MKKLEKQFVKSVKRKISKMRRPIAGDRKAQFSFEYDLCEAVIWKKVDINAKDMKQYFKKPHKDLLNTMWNFRFSASRRKIVLNKRHLQYIRRILYSFVDILNFDGKDLDSLVKVNFRMMDNFQHTSKWMANFKSVLVGILESNELTGIPSKLYGELKNITRGAHYPNCKFILLQIWESFKKIYGKIIDDLAVSQDKTLDEKIEVDIEEEEEEFQAPELTSQELIELIKERDKTKEELLNAEAENDFLTLQIDSFREKLKNAKESASKKLELNLFREFNSPDNQRILSEFAKIWSNIQEVEENDRKLEQQEIDNVVFFLELLNKFFSKRGLSTNHKSGEILDISLDKAHYFDYKGSEFKSNDEEKKVIVNVPGWKFQDSLVSKTQVSELKEEDLNEL